MKSPSLILLFCSYFLTGCSSIYHPQQGWVPEGYSETKLEEKKYSVTFQTYRGEDWTVIEDNLKRRAAQIALINAFSHFSLGELKRNEGYEFNEYNPTTHAMSTVSVIGVGRNQNSIIHIETPPYSAMHYILRSINAVVSYSNNPETDQFEAENILAGLDTP